MKGAVVAAVLLCSLRAAADAQCGLAFVSSPRFEKEVEASSVLEDLAGRVAQVYGVTQKSVFQSDEAERFGFRLGIVGSPARCPSLIEGPYYGGFSSANAAAADMEEKILDLTRTVESVSPSLQHGQPKAALVLETVVECRAAPHAQPGDSAAECRYRFTVLR